MFAFAELSTDQLFERRDTMRISSREKKAGAVLAAASALTFLNAPFASANWTSSISSWTDGDESRK